MVVVQAKEVEAVVVVDKGVEDPSLITLVQAELGLPPSAGTVAAVRLELGLHIRM